MRIGGRSESDALKQCQLHELLGTKNKNVRENPKKNFEDQMKIIDKKIYKCQTKLANAPDDDTADEILNEIEKLLDEYEIECRRFKEIIGSKII